MRILHFVFAVVMLIAFAVTGHFMRHDFPDKGAISPELRILMRSRHIYILLSALIHLALGVYLTIDDKKWRGFFQITGSVILAGGSVMFVYAFWRESYVVGSFSDHSRFAIYATLAGSALHLIGGLRLRR